MRSLFHVVRPSLTAALVLAACPAAAIELPNVGGEPVSLDVVNTAAATYHFDNRNDDPRYPSRYLDDNYGEVLNRLDAQINWWRLQLGTRLNASFYVARPSATSVELQQKVLNDEVSFSLEDARRELHTRYLTTVYPAKLWLTYTQPGIEATVGDVYAQLGRGLVFSVRKMDELAVDTTLRGGRLVLDRDFGSLRLEATAIAGQMNPLRVDDASGRRIHGDGSPLFFGFPGADDLVATETTVDAEGNPRPRTVVEAARPNYLEDTVLGGRLEAGVKGVELAVNGSLLLRKSYTEEYNRCLSEGGADLQAARRLCGGEFPEFNVVSARPARQHNTIRTFSGSVSIPSIAQHGDLYVEVAGQQLRGGHLDQDNVPTRDLSGYAVYLAANGRSGALAVSLEGKHYRRFFPLWANIDASVLSNPGFNAPEFELVAYNQPPTAEPVYVEPIGAPNFCVTGGRGRVDYRFNRGAALYAWLGRYVSFSERQENHECSTDDTYRTDTWDTAAGTEIDFDDRRSHVRAWTGVRHSDEADSGDVFYSEGYVRYDVVKHLTGAFSLQLQGNSRRRYRPDNFESSWLEGDTYLALQWSPHVAAIFGHEYSSQPGCEPGKSRAFCHFFNGGLQWKSGSKRTTFDHVVDTVQLFVGQRRGGLRCVSGVCRFFPSFEGARIELVSRF
ncbi:DUF6029 family protein [Sorangium sp. So ce1335]|uniref:DUF6029 family protein n=1 Tax=Sorangium sp. So ce1335 TaxID=3133335 RepID=UPI003F5F9A09